MDVVRPPRFRLGAGRLSLDFVRTLRHRGQAGAIEELPDAESLTAWCAQALPLLPALPSVSASQLAAARRLREATYDLVLAFSAGGAVPHAARAVVNRAAAAPTPAPRLDPHGQIRWYVDDPVASALSLVARDALDLVTSGEVVRVRRCAGEECSALFLDASRPGSRRWCSMDGCGNRAKKSAWRSRVAGG